MFLRRYLFWSQEGDGHGIYRMSLDELGKPVTNLANFQYVAPRNRVFLTMRSFLTLTGSLCSTGLVYVENS